MTGWSALAFALAGIGFLLLASPAHADDEGATADVAPASTAPAEEAAPVEPTTEAVDERSAPVAGVEPSPGQAATVVIENKSSGNETGSGSVVESGDTTGAPAGDGRSESTSSSDSSSPAPESAISSADGVPASTVLSAPPLSTALAPVPDASQATEDARLTIATSAGEAASDLSGDDGASSASVAVAGCASPDAQCGADDSSPGSPLGDTSSTGVSASASSTVSGSGGQNLSGSGGIAHDASADCSDSNGSDGSDVVICIAVGKGRLANGIGIGGDTQAGTEGSARFSNNCVISSYSGGPFAASLFASNSSLTG